MTHDLVTIRAQMDPLVAGVQKVEAKIFDENPINKDSKYLRRAQAALHEAIISLDHYLKDTETGRRITSA